MRLKFGGRKKNLFYWNIPMERIQIDIGHKKDFINLILEMKRESFEEFIKKKTFSTDVEMSSLNDGKKRRLL